MQLGTQTALMPLEVSPPTEEFRLKQQSELLLRSASLFFHLVLTLRSFICLLLGAGEPFIRHICSGSMMKEPVEVFPRCEYHFPGGSVETRAALTSLSPHLSAGTMTLYLSFYAQILSYQDEWREGKRRARRGRWKQRETEIEEGSCAG